MEDTIEITENMVYITSQTELDPEGEPLVVEYSLLEWQSLTEET